MRYVPLRQIWLCAMGHYAVWGRTVKIWDNFWGLLEIHMGRQTYKCNTKAHRHFFKFLCLIRNMCLIIADNLNVHSFSLKLIVFCKKPFLSKSGLFKKIFFTSINYNINQNMFKQKILIKYIYMFFYHWPVKVIV